MECAPGNMRLLAGCNRMMIDCVHQRRRCGEVVNDQSQATRINRHA